MNQPVCRLCQWTPAPHIPYWTCGCGAILNVFDHHGVCPECKEKFAEVQCPKCAISKPYSWWQGQEEKAPVSGTKVAKANAPVLPADLQERASAFLKSEEQFFRQYPGGRFHLVQLLMEDPSVMSVFADFIRQVAAGYGFTLAYPVRSTESGPLELFFKVIAAEIEKCKFPEEEALNAGVTNQYTLSMKDGEACAFYHLLVAAEN